MTRLSTAVQGITRTEGKVSAGEGLRPRPSSVLTRIDGCPRHVPRDGCIHDSTQCRYLVEQAVEVIARNTEDLGPTGRRHGRIPQFPVAKRGFADHLTRSHHGNAVVSDVHPRLPAEQDVKGVRRRLFLNQGPWPGRRGATCCSDDPLQVVVRERRLRDEFPEPTGAFLILRLLCSGGFLQTVVHGGLPIRDVTLTLRSLEGPGSAHSWFANSNAYPYINRCAHRRPRLRRPDRPRRRCRSHPDPSRRCRRCRRRLRT